jgi:hypothetical protein
MARTNPNRLLVEGEEDKRVIPYFMEKFIAWGNTPETRPVQIESFNGVEDLLKPGTIEAALKTSGLKALGVIIDANSDVSGRWKRVRERAIRVLPNLPEVLPAEGVIKKSIGNLTFGAWLMPNNHSKGMLETFLSLFISNPTGPLWSLVEAHCKDAKARCGAPFKEAHFDKARIHSWLAIQDPPGQSLHLAVLSKTLTPGSPHADSFVKWFRQLYSL